MILIGFPEYAAQARALAERLGAPCSIAAVHRFPDGESKVTLPGLSGHVVLCRSLDRPNDKLVELVLAAETARELGAKRLTLVAPYLCYMRQDAAFSAGEAVSQRIVGRLLARLFDDVVTVDPHLHRTATLAEAVPAKRAVALATAAPIGELVRERLRSPFVLGPDSESAPWVEAVAQVAGCPHAVATKVRRGDRDVNVALPDAPYAGREVAIVDDVASTGETLISAARGCLARGAVRVCAIVTHALFVDGAVDGVRRAGVAEVWSSDSVAHPTNAFPLAPLLAAAVRDLGNRRRFFTMTRIDSLDALRAQLRAFVAEREWDKFHNPKNLAMALVGEAGELVAHFQWLTPEEADRLGPEARAAVELEIADVLIFLVELADRLGIDPLAAAEKKLALNALRYPVEKARGNARKYDQL